MENNRYQDNRSLEGILLDLPRLMGGKPRSKRSRKPHTLPELMSGRNISRARKATLRASNEAKELYCKNKRIRARKVKKSITNKEPIRACNRRFLEYLGLRAQFLEYEEEPELFISKSKIAYEITDGLCPICTTTSAREALIICASLAKYGVASYFNIVKTFN